MTLIKRSFINLLFMIYCQLNQFNTRLVCKFFLFVYIFLKIYQSFAISDLSPVYMKSRVIIGTIATILFAKEFIAINKLQFTYPYISEPNNKVYKNQNSKKVSFKKNSWLLSIKFPQQFAQKFEDLADSDLILCQTPKGDHVFKIVGAVSRNYSPFESGVSNYIPPGFVFLVDPVKKQVGMVQDFAQIRKISQQLLPKDTIVQVSLKLGGKNQILGLKHNRNMNNPKDNHWKAKFWRETTYDNKQNKFKYLEGTKSILLHEIDFLVFRQKEFILVF